MEYLHVLSRPMVIDHDHDIIWTEAYMDSVVRTDAVMVNCDKFKKVKKMLTSYKRTFPS